MKDALKGEPSGAPDPTPDARPSAPPAGSERGGARRELREWSMVALVAAVVLLVLGRVSSTDSGVSWNYMTRTVYDIGVFALFALGLSLQFGMTGLINFGYAIFAGIGAYTVAIVGTRWGDTWASAMAGATAGGFAATLLFALLIGGVLAVPLMLLTQAAWPARLPPRSRAVRALVAIVPAALVALAYLLWAFPLSDHGARGVATGLAVILGMAVAALFGVLLGIPTVRLREDYLAIVTVGAAEIMRTFWTNEEWLTQGSRGIEIPVLPIREFAQDSEWLRAWAREMGFRSPVTLAYALAAVLCVILVFIVLETLQRSPWGRALNAIREDEDVAAALGKNVLSYKLQSLAIGCAIAALAGALYASELSSIYPAYFAPAITFNLLIILVIGGIGNHKGAIAGAIAFWGVFKLAGFLPDIAARPFFEQVHTPAWIALRWGVAILFLAALGLRWWARRPRHVKKGRTLPGEAWTRARWFRPALLALGVAAGALVVIGFVGNLAGAIQEGRINPSDLAGPPQAIFVGALLIAIMMWRPQGFVGRKEELQHGK